MKDYQETTPFWVAEQLERSKESEEMEEYISTNQDYLKDCEVNGLEPMSFYNFKTFYSLDIYTASEEFRAFSLRYLDAMIAKEVANENNR